MESENHHHQLQDQLVGSSSSSSPPCYGVSSTHTWTPTAPLNCSEFNSNYNGDNILHSRHKNDMLSSPQHSSMIQDWTNNEAYHGLHLPKIKDELSASMARFTDIVTDGSSNDNEQRDLNDLSEKLLLKTISSGFSMFNSAGPEFYSTTTTTQNCSIPRNSFLPSRGSFSQIYPSINISSFNQPSSSPNIPTSFDMNLEAMDLLNPARFSRSSRFSYSSEDEHHHHHNNNLDIYKEISPSFNLHDHHPNLQQSNQRPATYIPSKISPFPTEITSETKRPGILPEAKATVAAAAKKSRLESRAACPPFKVRKEKLGDRIAALQQLVAPFGKTDTASVLMEAIGYIKFLQNQVETLSVPYMKSCRNKPSRSKQGGSTIEDENEEESRRDLRSRGLCLVPLSCMSYVTSDSGGGMWPPPPPNFTG